MNARLYKESHIIKVNTPNFPNLLIYIEDPQRGWNEMIMECNITCIEEE